MANIPGVGIPSGSALPLSRTQGKSATTMSVLGLQSMHIPEIINGTWTNKFIDVIVPNTCSVCLATRKAVLPFRSKIYGNITKANCSNRCIERYEAIRFQAEKYKSANGIVDTLIKSSFFKPKLAEWNPDTRVGSVPQNVACGIRCSGRCNTWFDYAEANQPDGKTFKCRSCRGII